MIARRPARIGPRGALVVMLLVSGVLAFFVLDLSLADLWPQGESASARRSIIRDFFAAALSPTLDYESSVVPTGAESFLLRLLRALLKTVSFAAAAMSLAVIGGVLMALPASNAWWGLGAAESGRARRSSVSRFIQPVMRLVIAVLRSVHELLWAVVLLAMGFGVTPATAVVALAVPYAGTLAKVFSEMIDEAPRDSLQGLRSSGAGPASMFLFGLLPRALPDMSAYAFYRFECAVRSSAVLGFFGFETLGYYLKQSFDNLHYHEVWSHLYALIFLVLLLEGWSAALRRRFVV